MIDLSCNEVKKYYGVYAVLEGVTFDVKEGERIALIGKNGCGKSTLLKLIKGEETIDGGTIAIRKGLTIGYLEQLPVYEEGMTVREVVSLAFEEVFKVQAQMAQLEKAMETAKEEELELLLKQYGRWTEQFESLNGYQINERRNRICTGLKLSERFLAQEFCALSGGEKTLVGLAKVLLGNPKVLLLDEPTNHLDVGMLHWLEEYLKNYAGTVLLVSHDRYFLDAVATKVVEIENGKAWSFAGNYTAFAVEKEQLRAQQEAEYKEQQRCIKAMERSVKQMRMWADMANNEKMFARAKAMQRRIDRIDRVERPKEEDKQMNLNFSAKDRSGKDVLALEGVTKRFADKVLFTDAWMNIYYQEHVALLGTNGCGKTTLLRMLLGEEAVDDGKIVISASLKIGYLPQVVSFEHPEWTVLETLRQEIVLPEGKAREILARYRFYQDTVFKKVKDLSGGEQSRLKLAMMMQHEINFLILDEPTNHLDIASRENLEAALLSFTGTILFVSHDRYFINRIATRISEIEEKTIVSYYGDFNSYQEEKRRRKERTEIQRMEKEEQSAREMEEQAQNQMLTGRNSKPVNQEPVVKSFSESTRRYRQAQLEQTMEELEAKEKKIHQELELYAADYEQLQKLTEEQTKIEALLEKAVNEWYQYEG